MKASRGPRLETVKMVEDTIRENQGLRRTALWHRLPRCLRYQVFKEVLEYLVESEKVVVDEYGSVVWVFNPKLAKVLEKRSVRA